MNTWYRTCQECGFVSTRFKDPKGRPSDAYLNAACPKCKSEAFDYGSSADPSRKEEEGGMKRRLSDDQLRELVVSRITKGAAFTKVDYPKLLAETRAKLDAMTREEIFNAYSYATYDVKR